MKSIIQKLISLRSSLHSLFDKCFCKHWPDIERIGQESGWHIKTSELNSNSVVYSAGAGKDVSFEMSLAKRFGSEVYLVDPSPTGVKTMALPENQSELVLFFPIGLAGRKRYTRIWGAEQPRRRLVYNRRPKYQARSV